MNIIFSTEQIPYPFHVCSFNAQNMQDNKLFKNKKYYFSFKKLSKKIQYKHLESFLSDRVCPRTDV